MQTSLFDTNTNKKTDSSEWGTFKDSLKAPIHGWFTYPAGFSHKAVEHGIHKANLKIGKSTIYDPFMGSGTTNLVAKVLGYNSIGVEAHPFVYRITKTKMNWELVFKELDEAVNAIQTQLFNIKKPSNLEEYLKLEFPELILKCFLPETLFELLIIRNAINELDIQDDIKEFLRTALICVLRDVSIAATGWPYIAPNKIKITSISKKGWHTYKSRVYKMYGEISEIIQISYKGQSRHQILLGDSRNTTEQIEDESADYIFTSPPYLNNFLITNKPQLF